MQLRLLTFYGATSELSLIGITNHQNYQLLELLPINANNSNVGNSEVFDRNFHFLMIPYRNFHSYHLTLTLTLTHPTLTHTLNHTLTHTLTPLHLISFLPLSYTYHDYHPSPLSPHITQHNASQLTHHHINTMTISHSPADDGRKNSSESSCYAYIYCYFYLFTQLYKSLKY